MGGSLGTVPVKGKEGNRIEQRERSSCNAGWAALADTTGSSRLEWWSELFCTGQKWPVFLISASTVIVCGCPWDDLTLGKVAFCTQGNPWRDWQLGYVCWQHSPQLSNKCSLKRDLDGPSSCPPYHIPTILIYNDSSCFPTYQAMLCIYPSPPSLPSLSPCHLNWGKINWTNYSRSTPW